MGTSRPRFADRVLERVVPPVALPPDLVLKVARRRLEQHHFRHHSRRHPYLEDRTLPHCRPNDPRSSYRTFLHLHLLVQPEVGYDSRETPSRCRRGSITVLRGTTLPLPLSTPSSTYPRARVHLPSWSLPIPARPLLHIRPFLTHPHPLHPPSRFQHRQRQRRLPRHDTGASPLHNSKDIRSSGLSLIHAPEGRILWLYTSARSVIDHLTISCPSNSIATPQLAFLNATNAIDCLGPSSLFSSTLTPQLIILRCDHSFKSWQHLR
jgi:hypothetical protein